jgi:hypothetical protein
MASPIPTGPPPTISTSAFRPREDDTQRFWHTGGSTQTGAVRHQSYAGIDATRHPYDPTISCGETAYIY